MPSKNPWLSVSTVILPVFLFDSNSVINHYSGIKNRETLIAANAGGAWTPICDVTSTMLWIGGRTGGSILIIGSAAGVVSMGLANINFFWYLKKISLPALVGYVGGAGVFVLVEIFMK